MLRHGAELVLHGHTHDPTLYTIGGRDGPIPVLGVAAAGQAPGGEHPAAQYNLVEIDGEPGAWSATLERHGLDPTGKKVAKIETRQLVGRKAIVTAD